MTSTKTAPKVVNCYYCGARIKQERDLIEKKIPLAVKGGTRMYRRKFHIECISEYLNTMDVEKETKEENKDWDKCYEFFKGLLDIDEGKKLDQHAVLRILGLRLGTYVPNGTNVRGLKRGYTFDTILNSMKFSAGDIRKSFGTLSFKNQKHKIDYAMKIVTSNINFIDNKMEAKVKAERKLDGTTIVIREEESLPTYSNKSTQSDSEKQVQDVLSQFSKQIEKKGELDELESLFV